MDLINVYIQEVARRLPEKMREDISLELRSTILDMLPEDFTEEDVNESLEKLGDPAVLASRYRDRQMHLIGPKFFDSYVSMLKMVALIVAIVTFVVFFIGKAGYIFGSDVSPLIIAATVLGEAIWMVLGIIIHVFFWVTIVFVILERTRRSSDDIPFSTTGKAWTPKDLNHISYIPLKKEIKKSEALFHLLWAAVFTVLYFNAGSIIGIYEQGNNGLEFIVPVFNQETLMSYFVFVIMMIVLELFKGAYMLLARKWSLKLAVMNALIHLISIVVLIVIINNSNLLHTEFAPYMENLIEKPLEAVSAAIHWIKWGIVAIVIVTSTIDSYHGFRKARIK